MGDQKEKKREKGNLHGEGAVFLESPFRAAPDPARRAGGVSVRVGDKI